MPANDLTPNLQIPLVCNPSDMAADYARLRAAFMAVDAKLHQVDLLLGSDDLTLDTVQEVVAAIKASRNDITAIQLAVNTQTASLTNQLTSVTDRVSALELQDLIGD